MYIYLLQCGRMALPSTGVKINQSINHHQSGAGAEIRRNVVQRA